MPFIYAPSPKHIQQFSNDPYELENVVAKINRFIWTYKIYIGITSQLPEDRLADHQNPKNKYSHLWAEYMIVLWMTSDPYQVGDVERYLIKHFKGRFMRTIERTNIDNIGEGGEGIRYDRNRFFVYLLTDDNPSFLLGQFGSF